MDLAMLQRNYAALGLRPNQFSACLGDNGLAVPWRVEAIDRGMCTLLGLDPDGRDAGMRARCEARGLAVGDWVHVQHENHEARVVDVLARRSYLRRASVAGGGAQWIAANIDTVFIVGAFGPTQKLERRGVNARRFERYVSAVTEGGATPVVVLNKVDVSNRDEPAAHDLGNELRARLGVEVLCVSALQARGLHALEPYLAAGETVAFVGPSGVGKSTLLNTLAGEERSKTSSVRDDDQKGRHTTTRRQLFRLPSGALLVDTPGMREFAVWLEDKTVPGFEDVDKLAARCRFGDCEHTTEPGCAVREALDRGDLDPDRLRSYHSIQQDAARARARHDPSARHEKRQEAKRFGRIIKQAMASKKR